MPAPIMFIDIAGPDAAALSEFYSTVFDWNPGADGKFATSVSQPFEAAIRQDPAEARIYIGVPDIGATLAQVEASGGSVEQERFEVPGVVVLGLFRDPAGNPMGLIELADGQPRIP